MLRLPAAMLDDLRQLARRNDRPAAAEVRRAIAAHLSHPSTSEGPAGNAAFAKSAGAGDGHGPVYPD